MCSKRQGYRKTFRQKGARLWSHVGNSIGVTEKRTVVAAFLHTQTTHAFRSPSHRKAAFQENVPSVSTFGKDNEMSNISFFFFIALSSGAFAEQCNANRKKNQATQKKQKKDIMILMVFGSFYFFPVSYINGLFSGLIQWGHVTIRCHRNGHWLGFREMFDTISFITRHSFLSNTLISGIFLAYLLKTFHGVWMVSLHPSPFSTVPILHLWLPVLLRRLILHKACFLHRRCFL